jgi:hypothetical protein
MGSDYGKIIIVNARLKQRLGPVIMTHVRHKHAGRRRSKSGQNQNLEVQVYLKIKWN